MNAKKLKRLRQIAFMRQGCRCFYCDLPIWEVDVEGFMKIYGVRPRAARHLKCTAEHLLAQHEGGTEVEGNIAAACLWCNRMRHLKRHDKAPDPISYKRRISGLIAQGRWHPAVSQITTQ